MGRLVLKKKKISIKEKIDERPVIKLYGKNTKLNYLYLF